jgi:hypothetical protein
VNGPVPADTEHEQRDEAESGPLHVAPCPPRMPDGNGFLAVESTGAYGDAEPAAPAQGTALSANP